MQYGRVFNKAPTFRFDFNETNEAMVLDAIEEYQTTCGDGSEHRLDLSAFDSGDEPLYEFYPRNREYRGIYRFT